MLAPRPTPKLEDHPSSAVRGCLFNLFTATLHIGGHSSIRNPRTRHAVVTGTHIMGKREILSINYLFIKSRALCHTHTHTHTRARARARAHAHISKIHTIKLTNALTLKLYSYTKFCHKSNIFCSTLIIHRELLNIKKAYT